MMLGICLVGTGGIAAEHARAFAAIEGRNLTGSSRGWKAEAAKLPSNGSLNRRGLAWKELFLIPSWLVVIASPSGLHAAQTLQALTLART